MTEHKENGTLMLNGISLDEGIQKMTQAYLADAAHSDKAVPADHPVWSRQRRISQNTENIENIVKGTLGSDVRLNPDNGKDVERADNIIKRLAYEVAKLEKYAGKFEEFAKNEDLVLKYLGQASQATGNPTIGNKVELKKDILNMSAVRPGDPLYSKESPLALLIQYVAQQADDPSKQLNLIQTLLQQHATDARYINHTHHALEHATGDKFRTAATIPDMVGHIRRKGEIQAQEYAAKTSKTYLAPDHGAEHRRAA